MFWDKKDTKRLPDLPPLKNPVDSLEMHDNEYESHNLPSFPDSPMKKGFSQSAIKDAVTPVESDHEPTHEIEHELEHDNPHEEHEEKEFKTVEMEEWSPSEKITFEPKKPELPKLQPKREMPQERAQTPKMMPLQRTPPALERRQSPPERMPAPPERMQLSPFAPSSPRAPSDSQKNQDIFIKIDKFHSARKALRETQEKVSQIDSLLKKVREIKMREEQELSSWEKEVLSIKSKIQDVTQNIFEKLE